MTNGKFHDTWLSRLVPMGPTGRTKPRPYREMLGVLWENKSHPGFAWKILNHGVCDGCSLGPYGLRDGVADGLHLCMTRLKLLKLNTMGGFDPTVLGDVERLRNLKPAKLRLLGRLSYPMARRRNDRGFSRIGWDDALDWIAGTIRARAPNELGFVATSQRLTNEVYYVFQKLARVLGTNNIDLCSGPRKPDGVAGLKSTLGVAAPTGSLPDFIGTDLLVLFGTDLPDDQPVAQKYLRCAKKAGTKIVVVNPSREHGLERYRDPPSGYGLLYGARLADRFLQLRSGGNIAFLNGVLKATIADNSVDHEFIDKNTRGFESVKGALEKQSWQMLEERSGLSRLEMQKFAGLYGEAKTAVFVFTMDFVQQELGEEAVQAVVNLALARGMLGREKCGIMPMRGPSGIQGGGECGSEPDMFPGGFAVNEGNARRFTNLWRHPVSPSPGLHVAQMIEAAHRGEIKFLYSMGSNLLDAMPDHRFVAEAIARVPLRVYQDILLNPSMLVDAEEAVLLLPGQTRYEQRGGGISTSTERRIRFTPEIPGHKVGESRPEWEIPALVGRKAMSNGELLFPYENTQSIREEMARVMPIYQGVEKLAKEGDQLQWGGPSLYADGFTAMPRQRARFTVLELPDSRATHDP